MSTQGRTRPGRTVLYAVEGWGKSSLACHTPNPLVLMTRGEDGLRTLLANGLVPPTAHFDDEATTWTEFLLALQSLCVEDHDYNLVVDTLNGAAGLCVEHVVASQFNGQVAEFDAFGRGWRPAAAEWKKAIDLMTRINERGSSVTLLAHADVVTFKNPEATDYDRYTPRLHKSLWAPVQEWADNVLFGQLETFVKTDKPAAAKGKGVGGQNRLLYCQRTAVADAKNRAGLPEKVFCGQGPEAAWAALARAMADGRKAVPQPEAGV